MRPGPGSGNPSLNPFLYTPLVLFLRSARTPTSPSASSQGLCCPPREIPLPCPLAASQLDLFSGGGSGDSGLGALPVGRRLGWREQPPLSLLSQVCEQAVRQEGASAARLPADALPLWPSCWATLCLFDVSSQPWGLELHEVAS